MQALEALDKLKASLDEDGNAPTKVTPPEAPSCRCRELYSGSKFYWRLQDTLEYHVYLHLDSNCIEVIPYDNHSQTEYDRLYFNEQKLFELVGLDKIMERVKERQVEFEKEREKTNHHLEAPKEEDLLADERRQFVVSLLMSKLQFSIPDTTTGTKVVDCKLTVTEETDPLYKSPPDSVKPVLVKRRRLSTTAEIEAALLQATDMELEINVKLHEAEELENLAHKS